MANETKNSLVEEALLQMKALEEAVTENAKGILASTMKEEISELVKESLGGTKKPKSRISEQEDEDIEDVEDVEDENEPVGDDEEEDIDFDMSDVSDDEEDDQEFDMSMMGSDDMEDEDEMAPLDMRGASPEELAKVFKAMGEDDGIIISKDDDYIHLTDDENDAEYLIQAESDNSYEDEPMEAYEEDEEVVYELEMDEEEEEENETIYELEMDEEEESDEEEEEDLDEVYESMKPKGKVGKMKQFKYPNMKHGVTETSDEENESEWKEEEMEESSNLFLKKPKMKKEAETTESARTLGKGKSHGRNGLPKPRTYSSHVKLESYNKEIEVLREKNEEYKKALDFFRTKLNEVAVFNSNLAYATRLFTEHTTTKQEKINILRRFDNVESIKESKGLYKSIKEELDGNTNVVTESVASKVIKTPTTGSSNLIESKTYENPQFLRMKDLMNKIK